MLGICSRLTVLLSSSAVDVHVFNGLPHGFRRFGTQLSQSATWDRVIADGVHWILNKSREISDTKVHG